MLSIDRQNKVNVLLSNKYKIDMTIRVALSLPRMEFINNWALASVGDGGVGGMLLWKHNRV